MVIAKKKKSIGSGQNLKKLESAIAVALGASLFPYKAYSDTDDIQSITIFYLSPRNAKTLMWLLYISTKPYRDTRDEPLSLMSLLGFIYIPLTTEVTQKSIITPGNS